MKIRLTRNTAISGAGYAAGETLEIPETEAKPLILMGKAIEIPPAEPPDLTMGAVETPEAPDVKPAKTQKGKKSNS